MNWFEVDKEGLKELQDGKPKTFLIRELVQNALDENTTICKITMSYKYNKAYITVEDDSPTGFKDLSDAYILYKSSYKRKNPSKRGRFNLGEKQVFSICEIAKIKTTTGTITFDNKGRHLSKKDKSKSGSSISVVVKITRDEYEECLQYANKIYVPKEIRLLVNNTEYSYKPPYKIFNAHLQTENDVDGIFKRTTKQTNVHLHKTDNAYIYEMGLPVCEIDCDYDIDIQQKIPLSADRDSILPSFMKNLYAEVLNNTYEEVEDPSNIWVREAFSSEHISGDSVKEIIKKRFGDKSAIVNPTDRNSVDDAVSNGYNVIYGREMNKDEWNKVKQHDALQTTSDLFGKRFVQSQMAETTDTQIKISEFIRKIAKEFLNIEINISFLSSPQSTTLADFGNNHLRFNVAKLLEEYWELENSHINQELLDLVIHELGHSAGMHCEKSYHECITKLGSELTIRALEDPAWFKI